MRHTNKGRPGSFALATRRILVAAGIAGGGWFALALNGSSTGAEETRRVPPSHHDIAATGKVQTAVLAGGCFWGVQGAFQHVGGVLSATAGYAGGSAQTATYEATERGDTGHAEAVEIVFDPKQVSYGKILEIFFSIAHDPTQVGRQGPDVGPQYRSAIFPVDDEQARVAANYVAQLDRASVFGKPVATVVEPGKRFYRAEPYHQDYVFRNPGEPYVQIYELPKIEALRRLFPALYREKPVLVLAQSR